MFHKRIMAEPAAADVASEASSEVDILDPRYVEG